MNAQQPSEEELRAAYEAELERITVADVVLQTAVSLINLAGRRLGLGGGGAAAPGTEAKVDYGQARDAIDAVRGLMGVLERQPGAELGPLRDALSQLQMAYAKGSGSAAEGDGGQPASQPGGEGPGGAGDADAGGPAGAPGAQGSPGAGPAQSSGRLWVPGQ